MKKPAFEVLLKEAEKKGVETFDKNRDDLFFELAGKSKLPEFENIEVYERHISEEEKQRRIHNNEPIPKKTVFPKEIGKHVLSVLGRNPLAFVGYDFTREDNLVNYKFNRQKFKCFCGEEISFKKTVVSRATGVAHIEDIDIVFCPNLHCLKTPDGDKRREWIFIQS